MRSGEVSEVRSGEVSEVSERRGVVRSGVTKEAEAQCAAVCSSVQQCAGAMESPHIRVTPSHTRLWGVAQ